MPSGRRSGALLSGHVELWCRRLVHSGGPPAGSRCAIATAHKIRVRPLAGQVLFGSGCEGHVVHLEGGRP